MTISSSNGNWTSQQTHLIIHSNRKTSKLNIARKSMQQKVLVTITFQRGGAESLRYAKNKTNQKATKGIRIKKLSDGHLTNKDRDITCCIV